MTLVVTFHVASGTNAGLVNVVAGADHDTTSTVTDSDDIQIIEKRRPALREGVRRAGRPKVDAGASGNTLCAARDETSAYPPPTTCALPTSSTLASSSLAYPHHRTSARMRNTAPQTIDWLDPQPGSRQGITVAVTYRVTWASSREASPTRRTVDSDETAASTATDTIQIIGGAGASRDQHGLRHSGERWQRVTRPKRRSTQEVRGERPHRCRQTRARARRPNLHITDAVDTRLIVDSIVASPAVGADQDASTQGIDWLIPSLGPLGAVTLTVSYHVAGSTTAALVTNTATADSDEDVQPSATATTCRSSRRHRLPGLPRRQPSIRRRRPPPR
jgi:hypothetical protein